MNLTLKIRTIGYYADGYAAYASELTAESDDKRESKFNNSGVLHGDDWNKNRSDLAAIIMALRSVKDEHKGLPTEFYGPPGYATQMIDSGEDGWFASPKSNLDLVEEARKLVESFEHFAVMQSTKNDVKGCIETVKAMHEDHKASNVE